MIWLMMKKHHPKKGLNRKVEHWRTMLLYKNNKFCFLWLLYINNRFCFFRLMYKNNQMTWTMSTQTNRWHYHLQRPFTMTTLMYQHRLGKHDLIVRWDTWELHWCIWTLVLLLSLHNHFLFHSTALEEKKCPFLTKMMRVIMQ